MKPFDFYLSKSDEHVPEKYIPLTEFFLNPNYALPGYSKDEWVLGVKKLDELRKKTFSQVKKRFIASGAKSFASFWNGNLDAINEAGLNQFASLSAFRDLSACMIAFECKKISTTNKRNNRYISFGISKKNYKKYYESIKNAISNGCIVEKLNLYDPHKKRLNDMFSVPTVIIEFDGTQKRDQHRVVINKTNLYYEFERWCKIHEKTKKQGIYEAIQLLLEQHPISESNTENILSKKNEFGSLDCVFISRESGIVNTTIKIHASLYDTVNAVIRRFNSDPANISKGNLSMSKLASQALSAYIKRLPLKYVDPIAYKEYLEIKSTEEYNKKLTEGDMNAK